MDAALLAAELCDEGLICVDRLGVVTLFNRKAKESTGILLNSSLAHPAGVLAPGDIVLLADTRLGEDDGGLDAGALAPLGLRDPDVLPGDGLLAAGVWRNGEIAPLYRHCKAHQIEGVFRLEGRYLGLNLLLSIDRQEQEAVISVNGTACRMRYRSAIGNLVVVDGATGSIKFFQDKGYTIRREAAGDVLRGRPFQAKGEGVTEFSVLGASFFTLMEPCALTQVLRQVLEGAHHGLRDQPMELNKRLMLTSLLPVTGECGVEGAVLKVVDLSDMRALLRARDELIHLVEETDRTQVEQSTPLPPGAFVGFAGSGAAIQQVKLLAYRAARAKCNVIITGESGTGKSQLAQEIHALSRPGKPFVEVNCASIPPALFESELFGYVGGAFTGALPGGKSGYFTQAEGGTLFLDELGELPPDIQVKLLYVIQNKRYYPVGGGKPQSADVRILCATNRDLRAMVEEGRFRQDLYYRVWVFPIELPPLRARQSDLYVLSRSITARVCAEYGLPPKQLSARALEKLLRYDWPGNIRELGNVIERAVAVCDGSILYPEYFQLDLPEEGVSPRLASDGPADGRPLRAILEETEAHALRAALERSGGDKKAAMEALGLKKSAFYEKLKHYGIGP